MENSKSSSGYVKPAFVLGITGNTDPIGYVDNPTPKEEPDPAIAAISEAVFRVLDWVRRHDASSSLILHSGASSPPLATGELPIIVLSSLAPGIDTLVAEATLEYAKARRADVTVRAPLPFPEEIYPEATTFRSPAQRKRFIDLVAKIRAQPSFCEARDLFPVGLHPKIDGDPEKDLTARDANGNRRNLRYRAAGEYVAAYSDLLIAIFDEIHDGFPKKSDRFSPYECGTTAIVHAKRHGLTHNLLPIQNVFDWTDSGAVLHFPIDRQKKAPGETLPPCPRKPVFYQPFDCLPEDCGSDCPPSDPQWQSAGDGILRSLAENMGRLHRESAAISHKIQGSKPLEKLLKKNSDKDNAAHARAIAATKILATAEPHLDFGALARTRSIITEVNYGYEDKVKNHLGTLFVAAAAALAAFQIYGTLDFGDGVDSMVLWKLLALATGIGITGVAWLRYRKFQDNCEEDWQLDSRAIADGLRVQFYWTAAGIEESAASHYLQRQRGELSWIRSAISSVSAPYHRTTGWVRSLSREDTSTLFRALQCGWLGAQREYFDGSRIKFTARKDSISRFGYTLITTGFILLLTNALAATLGSAHLFESARYLLLAGGLLTLVAYAFQWHRQPHPEHPQKKHFWRIFFPDQPTRNPIPPDKWEIYRVVILALPLAAITIGLSFTLFATIASFFGLENPPTDWIASTQALAFAGGGLAHFWAARRFLSENINRYTAMHAFFRGVYDTMDADLEAFEKGEDTIAQIQELLITVGTEALAENAEWLLMHRDRRVEPIVTGA